MYNIPALSTIKERLTISFAEQDFLTTCFSERKQTTSDVKHPKKMGERELDAAERLIHRADTIIKDNTYDKNLRYIKNHPDLAVALELAVIRYLGVGLLKGNTVTVREVIDTTIAFHRAQISGNNPKAELIEHLRLGVPGFNESCNIVQYLEKRGYEVYTRSAQKQKITLTRQDFHSTAIALFDENEQVIQKRLNDPLELAICAIKLGDEYQMLGQEKATSTQARLYELWFTATYRV